MADEQVKMAFIPILDSFSAFYLQCRHQIHICHNIVVPLPLVEHLIFSFSDTEWVCYSEGAQDMVDFKKNVTMMVNWLQ